MLHKTKKSNTAFACLLSATLMSCALRPTSPIVSAIPTPDGPELTSPEPRITAIEKPPQPKLEVEPESQHAFHINASQSKVTYRAREKWIKEDVLDIVLGGTQQISGVIWLKPAQPRNAQLGPMTVNLYSMRSDDQERDEKVRHQYLDSAQFPLAIFTTTALVGLPASYKIGEVIRFQALGVLAMRGITRTVTFEIEAQLTDNGETLRGTASAQFLMSIFGIVPPSKIGVTVVEDVLGVELIFVANAQ